MLLFAYSRAAYSGHKIALMNEEMIPMKWLTRDTYVCYRSINTFRSNPKTAELIKYAFIHFTYLLHDNGLLKDNALFIDDTKVEADANKYSFTWRKSVEKYEVRLNDNIKLMHEQQVNIALTEEDLSTSQGVTQMVEATEVTLEAIQLAIEA